WDLEFTEIRPLDVDLDEELTARGEHFLNLHKCILKYAGLQQSNIWAYLGENNVPVKSLVAALSFFVLTGKNKKAKVEQRLNSLHAASLYLLLLGMPGSIANKVFHEILFDTCLDLSSHCWPENSGKKRKKDGSKSSKADGKRSRPQRKDLTDEGEEEEEEIHLSGSDLMKIRDALFLLLQSLLKLLQTLSLKDRPQSLSNCTRVFTHNLLYFEPVIGEIEFAPLKCVPEMAFYGLQLLCSPKHGDPKESLRRVFHQLLYVILMMSKGNRKKPTLLVVNQAILSTRDQTISFVSYLVEELKELAVPFLHILLQHICVQMVEKSEFRSHGAQAVSMLTSEMTNTDYSRFIRWLLNFSRHPKMACRLFAVDVAVALLGEPERKPEECQDPGLAPFLQHKLLIQSLLFSGQMDESPTVQGHALSSLAKCLEIPSMNVTQAIHNLFNESKSGVCTQISKANLALLFRRVKDSRTSVRKSALQALMGLLKHDVIPASSENLFVLSERCRDPAVSVRKKTLQCMGELLTANPLNIAVQKAWLHGVVPVVLDSENTVQDRALEALEQMLLHPITSYSSRSHQDTFQRLAWDLLVLLCQDCKNLCNYLGKAFSIWSKQNKFTPSFITNLISHTEAEHASGAWLLLSKVGSFSARPSLEKIVDAWDRMISSREINVTVCCHILCVIGNIAAHLNEDTKERMIDDLMSRLKRFDMSLEVISAAVDTLFQLGRDEDIKQTQVCRRCDKNMIFFFFFYSCFLVGKRTVLLVESVLTTNTDKLKVVYCQVITISLDCKCQTISRMFSHCVANHGLLMLFPGKLCLQHEELVQKYLPVFARELEVGTEMAVRNNVVIVMCDLCVRYTAIVDHYVPNISACLRDSEAVIREQALIMLTNLLQEEFVKWKGSLFFRFMVALVDPEPAIASLCKYCLLHLLLKKNPDMFSQHFIECIFHLNCYDKHKSYKFPQSER
uniref:Non-SMC condensin II complex, subunit D3 n=1 Tax=Cynoglossus semilaevis TaxID=244447 RepID=A0A3P8WQ73_CYNSE